MSRFHQEGFAAGLLHAQQMANEFSHKAHEAGNADIAAAMAALSTDLLMDRLHVEERTPRLTCGTLCRPPQHTDVCEWANTPKEETG